MNASDKLIDAAINAPVSEIRLPRGIYYVSQPIQILRNQIDIFGYDTTIAISDEFPAGQPIIQIVPSNLSLRLSRITIHGLDVADIRKTGKECIGLNANRTFRLNLVRCNFNELNGPAIVAKDSHDFVANYTDCRNCGSSDLKGSSVHLIGTPAPIPGVPHDHTGMNTVTLDHCTVENYRGVGVLAEHQTVLHIERCKVHGIQQDRSSSKIGILIDTCNRVGMVRNHHVLANDVDIDVRNSRVVDIERPVVSLGRNLKFRQSNSDVEVH